MVAAGAAGPVAKGAAEAAAYPEAKAGAEATAEASAKASHPVLPPPMCFPLINYVTAYKALPQKVRGRKEILCFFHLFLLLGYWICFCWGPRSVLITVIATMAVVLCVNVSALSSFAIT